MFSHYLKLAAKALLKHKYYTFINIFGLVCGMLSALIIAKYIGGTLQFDRFHLNKDKIYAITQRETIDGNLQENRNATYWGVGALIQQYPEIERTTRYSQHVESLVIVDPGKGDRISAKETRIFAADSAFLGIFTFPLIYGDVRTALSKTNSVILTKSTSQKYFGNTNPIGKVITLRVPWGAETIYEVTGVAEDLPRRSRFAFDFLTSQSDIDALWHSPDFSIYALLKDNAQPRALAEKLTATLAEVPELQSTNRTLVMSLDSIARAQLSGTAYLLAAVGIFIVLISWVNYINQIVAQSYWRIKEIGILRVIGATRANLKMQFVVESSLTCLTSLGLIIVIYLSIEPALQSFTRGHLLPLLGDRSAINPLFLGIFVAGIALAVVLSTVIAFSQNFGTVQRNLYTTKMGGVGLRKTLVVVQFSISTLLVISIFVIANQFEYINAKEKGYNMDNILVVSAPLINAKWEERTEGLQLFKEQCAGLPYVIGVTSSTTVPGEEYRHETYLSLQEQNHKSLVHQSGVDEHFLDMYEVQFIAGRNFVDKAWWKNRTSIILNESAARGLNILDFDEALNTKIVDHESNEVFDLVGIVKDFHQTSLKYEMKPMAFKFNRVRGHFSIRINNTRQDAGDFEKKLASIKQIWEQVYHDASFDYFLLEEKFETEYAEDRYFGTLFEYFTVLSIVISCLGLLGLSLLISTKRQMEIGIRKVFGASSLNILTSLLKGYLGPLCLSVAIGSPLAYLLMNMWLTNYAYRIEIGMELISTAILTMTIIFLISVAYHTIKSSLANPVKILRN